MEKGGASERLALSWDANAQAWTRAVRERAIESRRVGTDAAIITAVVASGARRVLDVGCGEGWLARELTARGLEVVGVDASLELVEAARAAGGGEFHRISYDEMAAEAERVGLSAFDAAVCNFALLDEDIEPLLRSLTRVLRDGGVLLIQTVHPWLAAGDEGYADGWRTEAFTQFGDDFRASMPWYYRTLESWVAVVRRAGYVIDEMREPVHPETGRPLSLLLVLRVAASQVSRRA